MKGKIISIKWVVVELQFEKEIPNIYDALIVDKKNSNWDQVVIEVLQLLEDWIVKWIAMNATDGLKRWDTVTATWNPISIPVGPQVLWHIFNVLYCHVCRLILRFEICPLKAQD